MITTEGQNSILSSDLTLRQSTLWLGTIHLYEDHLSITGWGWAGKVDHALGIDHIHLVEMWLVPRGVNLAIYPEERSPFYCRVVEDLLLWGAEFRKDERIRLVVQPEHYPSFSVRISSRPTPIEMVS